MAAKDVREEDLKRILNEPAIRLVNGAKDWITTHDLANCCLKLSNAIEQFGKDVNAACDKMGEEMCK